MTKDETYKLIQKFLQDPPVVIWGSGATIDYGLPSMNDLNDALKKKYAYFDKNNTNLEEELGKDKYEPYLSEIRKTIWECIAEKDNSLLNDILNNFKQYTGIKLLIEKFSAPYPNIFNIITTNYDRVLENILVSNNFAFTDGFSGRILSLFDEELFINNSNKKSKNSFVNLIKVHGSLNWFNINGETRYYSNDNTYEPTIIPPGKNKYKQAYSEPYRSLIQISDKTIKSSKSILVIGFGFNDEHITPRITEQIKKGVPIVILTKELTKTTKEQLKNASYYLALEEGDLGKTRITYKEKSSDTVKIDEFDGFLWQLNNFMEAF